MYSCLRRSVHKIHWYVAETLSNKHTTATVWKVVIFFLGPEGPEVGYARSAHRMSQQSRWVQRKLSRTLLLSLFCVCVLKIPTITRAYHRVSFYLYDSHPLNLYYAHLTCVRVLAEWGLAQAGVRSCCPAGWGKSCLSDQTSNSLPPWVLLTLHTCSYTCSPTWRKREMSRHTYVLCKRGTLSIGSWMSANREQSELMTALVLLDGTNLVILM